MTPILNKNNDPTICWDLVNKRRRVCLSFRKSRSDLFYALPDGKLQWKHNENHDTRDYIVHDLIQKWYLTLNNCVRFENFPVFFFCD